MLHGDDPGTHDFRHVGCLVQAQAEQRRHEWRDQLVRIAVQPERGERDADVDALDHQVDVEPEENLDQDRGAAEKPDVEPAHPGHYRVRRQAHHGQDRAQDDADGHREHRQLEGDQDSSEDEAVEEKPLDDEPSGMGPEHSPIVSDRGPDGIEDVDGDGQHDDRRHPAPRVSDRDRLDRRRPHPYRISHAGPRSVG